MYGIETVDGVVIGEVTKLARLFSPKGTEQARTCAFSSDDEIRNWADEQRKRFIAQVGEQEAKWLGWFGQWELRITD
jgi:hypothetical protein